MADQLTLPRCPHCGIAAPLLTRKWQLALDYAVDHTYWGIFMCTTCNMMITARHRDGTNSAWGCTVFSPTENTVIYPADYTVDPSIPDAARTHLIDAINSRAVPNACVMLSASAVDAMLQFAGYSKGSLFQKINSAAAEHRLTKEMAAWAHSIRIESNAVRHADHSQPAATSDEADACLKFAQALGDYLYVLPSRVRNAIALNPDSSESAA